MKQEVISDYFERARATLKTEHDSMVQKVREQIAQSKQKVLSKT